MAIGTMTYMEYDDDSCPICHQLLENPASTDCGHTACLVCLLTWIAASKSEPQSLSTSFQISAQLQIDGLWFTCPLCRTETTASLDDARRTQLQERGKQGHINHTADVLQHMTIQLGNTHKNVPPSISPLSGMIRTHRWAFFLAASQPDIIESVDLLLHESFRNHRFVTLRKPPFTKASLGWGYFRFTFFITLRDGWEWVSPDAVNTLSKNRGPKDRLPVDWSLSFDGGGSQLIMSEQFRKIENMDTILPALSSLFGEECADVGSALSDGEETC